MNQLKLVIPVGDFRIVMEEMIGVSMEISKWLSIICDDSLAAMQLRRTVVADDIQNDLDIPLMQCLDHSAQGGSGL
jgi:hypothetical protein